MRRLAIWIFLCTFFLGIIGVVRINHKIRNMGIDFNLPIEIEAKIEEIIPNNEQYKIICRLRSYTQNDDKKFQSFKFILYHSQNLEVGIGDIINISGNIEPIEKPKNPGGFNQRSYYFSKKTYFNVYSKKIEMIQHHPSNIKRKVDKLRKIIEERTYKIFPKKQASVVNTILIGSKDRIEENTKQLYKAAGISHLLAISGLHISILGMGILIILKKFISNQKASAIIAVILLWMYCSLSGGSISSIRATFMFTFMLLSLFFNESYDLLSGLFISATIIILVNPYQLMDIGFLLSFSAVLGIGTIAPLLNSSLNKKNQPILNLIFVSFGASVFTYPILLWYFYELPLYAIIINLLVIPVMAIIMIFSILSLVVSYLCFPIGIMLGGIVFFILNYIELCCEGAITLPFHTLIIGKPSILSIILYYVGIYIFMQKKKEKYMTQIKTIFASVCMLITIINSVININNLKITLLDVEQGDSAVIEYNNKVFIIDGGGQVGKKNKSEKNTGTYVLQPFLSSQGISTVNGIFISHSDFDHIYGIIEIIGKVKIKFIALSKPYEKDTDPLVENLLEKATQNNIEIYYIDEGFHYSYKGLNIECIYPKDQLHNFKNNNGKSMVLNMSYKDFSILFTGDIEKEQEGIIASQEQKIVDIIKVPHHGSKTSSTESLLNRFKPKTAVFSYGKRNPFGHPSEIVVDRYKEKNIGSYHIENEGAVIVATKGKTYTMKTYFSKRRDKYLCKN